MKKTLGEGEREGLSVRLMSPYYPVEIGKKVSKIPLKRGDDTNDTNCVRFHKVETIYL